MQGISIVQRLLASYLSLTMIRLRAASLIYALMISMLITLVIGGLVLLMHYQRMLSERLYARELARDNLVSATHLFLNSGSTEHGERRGILFDSASDSFYVKSEAWGVLGLLHIRATHGTVRVQKSCLYGSDPSGVTRAALHLQDQNKSLKLVGKSRLAGTAYLPRGGVSGGRINRLGFLGKKLITGEVHASRSQPVNINYQRLRQLTTELNYLIQGRLPLESESLSLTDSIGASWSEDALYLPHSGALRLNQAHLSGKCIVIASESIYVTASNELDHVLLIAPHIVIQDGFAGRIQAIATDSIRVGESVLLSYPSALVVSGTERSSPGRISIGTRSRIEGVVINDPQLAGKYYTRDQVTQISPSAQIYGHVISPGTVIHEGEIFGSLVAGKFILNTGSSVYVNHLRDATISYPDLSPHFTGGLYVRESVSHSVIEWLRE